MPTQTPDATNDPLIGTQEHTDLPAEAARTPFAEMTLEQPPHGLAVKSRMVAGLLGVLLGGLGVHRFYLGYWRIGLFQIGLFMGTIALCMGVGLLMTQATPSHLILIALSCALLVPAWGLGEGMVILLGGLTHDAHDRPLL